MIIGASASVEMQFMGIIGVVGLPGVIVSEGCIYICTYLRYSWPSFSTRNFRVNKENLRKNCAAKIVKTKQEYFQIAVIDFIGDFRDVF